MTDQKKTIADSKHLPCEIEADVLHDGVCILCPHCPNTCHKNANCEACIADAVYTRMFEAADDDYDPDEYDYHD